MNKGMCTLKLENLQKVYNSKGEVDPSLVRATFSILDFRTSGNKQLVSKVTALNSAHTLKFKPLVCQYTPTTDYDNPNDDFGTHCERIDILRSGEEFVSTGTFAIGVSEKDGYLGVINQNGEELDVLMADFVLWAMRYPNEISLINDFYEKGEPLYTSCEYYYSADNIEVKTDDFGKSYEEIKNSILFDGHCVLGRNVEPAYESSKLISFNTKWNKSINQLKQLNSNQNQNTDIDINNNSQKEEDNMAENKFYKALCELSFGDIKEKIMTALSKNMNVEEFYNVWLSNYGIYDTYFVYENYEDGKYVNYKVTYTTTETEVVVDLANKVQVERDSIWIEVGVMETQLNSLNEKINELTTSLNTKDGELTTANTTLTEKDNTIQSLNSQIETLTNEKVEVEQKFNSATDTIISLNAKVEEMKPIVNEHNKEQYEKALNEKKDFYLKKFNSVKAVEKFNTDEVQELIIKTLNENEEGNKAVLALNSIIVDLVPVEESKTQEPKVIKEFNSTMSNLIPTETDFESRYGL
jgi:hypothetical protein